MPVTQLTTGDVYSSLGGTAVNDTSGGGTISFSNPSRVTVDDSLNASAILSDDVNEKTHRLKVTDFSLGIPSGYTIKRLAVEVEYDSLSTDFDLEDVISTRYWSVRLLNAGTPAGNDKAANRQLSKGFEIVDTFGGTVGDMWGLPITPTYLDTIGVYIQLNRPTAEWADTIAVDRITILAYTNVGDRSGSGGGECSGTSSTLMKWYPAVSGGAKAGGSAAVALVYTLESKPAVVAGGTVPHSYSKVISGGVNAGGLLSQQMTFAITGDDGGYFRPVAIQTSDGWTGSYTDIDEPVDSSDGATTYVQGINPTANFLEVLTGQMPVSDAIHTIRLKLSAKAETVPSGFNLLAGVSIGGNNVTSEQLTISNSGYSVYTVSFTGVLPAGPVIAYFAPIQTSATIRISAVEIFASTGAVLGGDGDDMHGILISADPIKTAGEAIVQETVNITADGGSRASGTPDITWIVNFSNPVPVVVGATAEVQHSYVPNDIGAVLGGAGVDATFYGVEGGTVAGGIAEQQFVDYVDGEGGSLAGGEAVVADLRVFFVEATGEVEIGGESFTAVKDWFISSDGGDVVIGGEAEFQMVYHLPIQFLWNLRSAVRKEITFLWNTGQLPIFWYRIISQVNDPCKLDPCCEIRIDTIHARTPSELCQKLRGRKPSVRIQSVHRFTRPAENNLVTIEHDCNEFEEVELCDIPLCAEFCLEHDQREIYEFDMRVQIDAFKEYEASGSVYITGQAATTHYRDVPAFEYEGSGDITMGGTASALESNVTAQGGVSIGGTASAPFSHWEYVGGQWPYEAAGTATTAQSIAVEDNDQIWAFPEEALADNDDWTQSDISYGQTSEFLTLKGWGFNLSSGQEILSLTVTINRHSTSINVRDLEVYLVNGDEVISDNLADISADWPVFMDSTKTYGPDWRSEGTEHHLGVLGPADISDADFGVAIRVTNLGNSISIAKIDSVSMALVYQDSEHQTIRLESASTFIAPTYYAEGSGYFTLGSATTATVRSHYSYTSEDSITVSGTYETVYNDVARGGVTAGGEGLALPYFEVGNGGMRCGGEAEVKPFWEVATGGPVMGGLVSEKVMFQPVVSGGVKTAGFSPVANYSYTSSGGIVMAGEVTIVSSNWIWNSDGNGVFPLGAADTVASHFGDIIETAEFSMSVVDLIVAFDEDAHVGDAVPLNDTLSKCGCTSIPLFVNVQHNIGRSNKFSQFLDRNGYVLPNILKMGFNTTNQSWQRNVHYRGLSPDADTTEVWDFVFELQCTSIVGGEDVGTNVWKFAVDIFRKVGNFDYNTKVWIGVLPDKICNTFSNELVFAMTYNTLTNAITVLPNATVYEAILYDNIGLFKNAVWRRNPNLVLNISQAALETVPEKLDLTEIILEG